VCLWRFVRQQWSDKQIVDMHQKLYGCGPFIQISCILECAAMNRSYMRDLFDAIGALLMSHEDNYPVAAGGSSTLVPASSSRLPPSRAFGRRRAE